MMHKLWISLPAFSPDYSGVCSAFYDLGGLTVIHDAAGCTGNYTGYDEPRYYGSDRKIFCSGLREIDAVLGRDDKLIEDILKACKELNPTLVTILGSPVPTVIGTDFIGIAKEIEKRTELPTFGFPTTGLNLYNKGVSDSMLALLQRFTAPIDKKYPRGVNILGVTPLDFGSNGNSEALIKWLESNGFNVITPMMMGASIESITNAARASVNLVPCAAGMEAALYLEKKYGIPWVAALPLGNSGDTLELLEASLSDGISRALIDASDEGDVIIVAEQITANSLRRLILSKYPDTKISVATMFGLDTRIAAPGDFNIPDESALRDVIYSGRFKKLVGDPLFQSLNDLHSGVRMYSLPHPAISSKLHWNELPEWLGKEMYELVNRIVKE